MLSFFNNRKPRQFNFKPVYHKQEKEGDDEKKFSISENRYTEQMYNKWERIPFSELEKEGKKRLKRISLITGTAILIIWRYWDEIEEILRRI